MIKQIQNWWPALACLVVYYSVVLWMVGEGAHTQSGAMVYPLDDTYIHMSMAKNTAEHGVWGFTEYAFSSSTTSPLWTALLALAYTVVGTNEWIPLVLNLIVGSALIVAMFRSFQSSLAPVTSVVVLLLITFATSIPALTVLAMEHLLHALITLAFVVAGARLVEDRPKKLWDIRWLFMLAALLPITRYEGVLAIALLWGILVVKRRYRDAFVIAAAGAIPVLLYGLWSIANHWLIVPNSVLLKGNRPSLSTAAGILDALGMHAVNAITASPLLILLVVMTVGMLLLFSRTWWRAVLLFGILLLHVQLASIGWLFRYEGYLVAVTLAITLPELILKLRDVLPQPRRLSLSMILPVIGLMLLAAPFIQRGVTTIQHTVMASHDRNLEHLQPARFLQEYYPSSTVVVNDIGAAAYYSDCRFLDMYGLGSMEPVRHRMTDPMFTAEHVQAWATREGASIAVLQVQWGEVSMRTPSSWKKVAEWIMPRNVVFGDTRIGFYAIKPELAEALAQDLRVFQSTLPGGITVKMIDG